MIPAVIAETPPLSQFEARQIADAIRNHAGTALDLLVRLHQGQGWTALGYKSWTECYKVEFDLSGSQACRYLAAARIEMNILGDGRIGILPESVTRPLKPLDPAEQREAWDIAVTAAPEGKFPTAKQVEAAVAVVAPDKARTRVNGEETVDPPDIAKLRKAGKIGADVVVDITEHDPDDEPANVLADETPTTPHEPTDAEYLDRMPARAKIAPAIVKIFDGDALVFKAIEDERKAMARRLTRAINDVKRQGYRTGKVTRRWESILKLNPPGYWKVCPAPDKGGCDGTGMLPELLGGTACPLCKGEGYVTT